MAHLSSLLAPSLPRVLPLLTWMTQTLSICHYLSSKYFTICQRAFFFTRDVPVVI